MRLAAPAAALALAAGVAAQEGGWQPAELRLPTRWTWTVTPENAHPEHPRPALVRPDWTSLNGLWSYAVRPRDEGRPAEWEGEILVPFAIESSLSGVARRVSPDERLWYRRALTVPDAWRGRPLLLHFGAVDWTAEVWLDGMRVGEHAGGYDPFSILIEVPPEQAEHELVVAVWDPTDAGPQPRGKQVRDPHGIWYTPTTGIWRTVWLEPVPPSHVASLRTELVDPAELEAGGRPVRVRVVADVRGPRSDLGLEAVLSLEGQEVARVRARGTTAELVVEEPRPWSPDDPALYDLRVQLVDDGTVVDEVESYAGLRTIAVAPDADGVPRLFLNGEVLFQYGLLDQGFWPDGLYTAPTDAALLHDVAVTKRLGFNLARKHVKVEPERWYYHCDRLGLLVWQDVPSGGPYIGPSDSDATRTPEEAEAFQLETRRIVDALRHHPSIVSWVLFNEGWGQHDTEGLTDWLSAYDPTRLVNAASGWTDRGVGHVHDVHRYPGPAVPPVEGTRAAVLGEFGGLGLPLARHTWQDEGSWGYRSFETKDELTAAYMGLVRQLRPLIAEGLAAAVYTQTSDVEIEVNGVMTYDRAFVKLDEALVAEANRRLYLPPPIVEHLVTTSRHEARAWRYRFEAPEAGWAKPDFDDGGWAEGPGGFGTAHTPGAVVGTEWSGEEIWIRRRFELQVVPDGGRLCLYVHHDEDAEVHLNGASIVELAGYTTGYVLVPVPDARRLLVEGENTLAVHCRQTGGGQFVDAGLAVVRERR